LGRAWYRLRDTPLPCRQPREVTEFHMNRVWSRTGAPFVGVIIAPMQQGETWTGGYAGSVVGNPETGDNTSFEEH
ncbi:MAG TPA: hypothetical protein VMP68_24625, partial [Candidatus Eisenbacteria bacterium]|nr:hypothetical protein [Candidatus Eisenbacteria bacterium]